MEKRHTLSCRVGGVELVRAFFLYSEEVPEAWIAAARAWVDESLLPYAAVAYETDPSENKRFSFRRFEYSLSAVIDGEENTFSLKAVLSRGGETLAESTRRERFCPQSCRFLPPIKTKKRP